LALARATLAICFSLGVTVAAAGAVALPARIAPSAPFPAILTQAPTLVRVAPGVRAADYFLWTIDGPLAIHVVAIDPHRSDVHLATVLANDRLFSGGERVSAMAARTGAVAGINGDYFDIGATGAPTNIVVDAGRLLRTPRKRAAFVLEPGGAAVLTELSFTGSVQIGTHTVPLTGIDELPPPDGGIALITPALGVVPPMPNITLIALDPLDGTPPFARYRARAIVDNTVAQPEGTYLAIAAQAYSPDTIPNPGDVIAPTGDLAPIGIAQIAEAIGGGPILLRDGRAFDDPDGPNGATFARRIPTSAVAIAPDGTIFLIEVDGRQPDESIGLLRPQFAALMVALGASDGMALDGGGSSTLVAREPGQVNASVLNSPSDGVERRIGDALLVYSDAPLGPASRAVITPGTLRALVGSSIHVTSATIDASGHRVEPPTPVTPEYSVTPSDLGSIVDDTFVASRPGRGTLQVAYGDIVGRASIVIAERPARLELLPSGVNLEPGESAHFDARALDADGFPLPLPATAVWRSSSGSITNDGTFTAAASNATVTLQADGTMAMRRVTVGRHTLPLALHVAPTFATAPRGGPGELDYGSSCPLCIRLNYDFTGTERAAYANLDASLPDDALGIVFDLDGDDSGAIVRVTFVNAIDEPVLVTATRLDFTGRHRIVVRLPSAVGGGARVASIYVIDGIGAHVAHVVGSITISRLEMLLPGASARALP
jgi:exopolysaccharide biosynthesis protein